MVLQPAREQVKNLHESGIVKIVGHEADQFGASSH
jgi:hypothetical protein